jgi:hypothetical protein
LCYHGDELYRINSKSVPGILINKSGPGGGLTDCLGYE